MSINMSAVEQFAAYLAGAEVGSDFSSGVPEVTGDELLQAGIEFLRLHREVAMAIVCCWVERKNNDRCQSLFLKMAWAVVASRRRKTSQEIFLRFLSEPKREETEMLLLGHSLVRFVLWTCRALEVDWRMWERITPW
jgi:hypothetical protein